MARPQKTGLQYFPLDCGFFSNRKVKALRRAHGQIGLLAYLNVLCKIYANGYYLKVDDMKQFAYDIAEEIANDHLASVSARVASAISYMASIGLLSKDCLAIGVLTGHAVQEQYKLSLQKSKRVAQIKEYAITDSPFSVQKNEVYSEETAVSTEETPVYSEEMTQKKIKEKNIFVEKEIVAVLGNSVIIDCKPMHAIDAYKQAAEALNQSTWARANMTHLSKIHRNWDRLLSGYYKDRAKKQPVESNVSYSGEQLNAIFNNLTEEDI